MAWLLSNWKLVLITVLSGLVYLFANLWQSEVKAFAEFKGAIVVLGQEAEKETKRVNDLNEAALKETKREWEKTLPAIRSNAIDNYMRRFPHGLCNSGTGIMPGTTNGSQAPTGAVGERVAAGPSTGDAKTDAFVAECAKDAGKLKSLREWVKKSNLKVEK